MEVRDPNQTKGAELCEWPVKEAWKQKQMKLLLEEEVGLGAEKEEEKLPVNFTLLLQQLS